MLGIAVGLLDVYGSPIPSMWQSSRLQGGVQGLLGAMQPQKTNFQAIL
jgi:hypothetical protein